ncbi:MAG: hypothetical protein BWY09_00662 [Candidatus Hydrogenedentes bacterium ADurb.Bin179]|nr:MAG: hypothetical protein BWY09_00662 [Candidatus Hydrogenedentes bacterium ADurb.Bin179]
MRIALAGFDPVDDVPAAQVVGQHVVVFHRMPRVGRFGDGRQPAEGVVAVGRREPVELGGRCHHAETVVIRSCHGQRRRAVLRVDDFPHGEGMKHVVIDQFPVMARRAAIQGIFDADDVAVVVVVVADGGHISPSFDPVLFHGQIALAHLALGQVVIVTAFLRHPGAVFIRGGLGHDLVQYPGAQPRGISSGIGRFRDPLIIPRAVETAEFLLPGAVAIRVIVIFPA